MAAPRHDVPCGVLRFYLSSILLSDMRIILDCVKIDLSRFNTRVSRHAHSACSDRACAASETPEAPLKCWADVGGRVSHRARTLRHLHCYGLARGVLRSTGYARGVTGHVGHSARVIPRPPALGVGWCCFRDFVPWPPTPSAAPAPLEEGVCTHEYR